MHYNEKLLLVDDDSNVLQGLRRILRTEFDVETAEGAAEGLEAVDHKGPFAVVISDLNMPGMDGIKFLSRVRELAPDTVRIVLSGQADLNAAISAVNEGSVFRFLTKPCSAPELSKTVTAAIEMYRLVTAERELLHRTLMGSITVLTEVLAVTYPAAFRRSLRIRWYVTMMSLAIRLRDIWQFEAAAMLSQIGCITLPISTANKVYSATPLSEDEARLFARHPQTAKLFLSRIPRLEQVAEIIAAQQKPYSEFGIEASGGQGYVVALGAQMLHIAIELERLVSEGHAFNDATALMKEKVGEYNLELLRVLDEAGEPLSEWRPASVTVAELGTSMAADQDIRAGNGLVLIPKGELITVPTLERLRCLAAELGVVEPIRVLVQQDAAALGALPRCVIN